MRTDIPVNDHDPFAAMGRMAPDVDTVSLERGEAFVVSQQVEAIVQRALAYLDAGYAVHLSGLPGTGKTALAFHIAAHLGRPVSLVHGDHEFGSSNLIGQESGYLKSRVVDNFVASVFKLQEEGRTLWVDNRVTTACRHGHTLIYDEFNRSRAEANNPLLSVLSEGVLSVPGGRDRGDGYVRVHSDFRAIFTSNPAEFAGVHKTQDALLDRLITIELGHYDRDTETEITLARSRCDPADGERIVALVRGLRRRDPSRHYPTIRASIAIASILARSGVRPIADDPVFRMICHDVLCHHAPKSVQGRRSAIAKAVDVLIDQICLPGDRGAFEPAASNLEHVR